MKKTILLLISGICKKHGIEYREFREQSKLFKFEYMDLAVLQVMKEVHGKSVITTPTFLIFYTGDMGRKISLFNSRPERVKKTIADKINEL